MIEFQQKLDSNKTTAINKHALKRIWWLFAIVSIIFLTLGIVCLINKEDDSDFSYGIFCIVVGVCFTPLTILLTKVIQKSINKSASYINPDTVEIFSFDDEGITIKQNLHDVFSATTEAKYSYIYKVIENPENYILYISRQLCHVVDKKSLTTGTIDELNNILFRKLGDKFKALRK